MLRSVQTRFVIIMLGATILFALPMFIAFSVLSAHSIEQQALARREQVIKANANALAKPLWDFDNEGVKNIGEAISRGENIERVLVTGPDGATLLAIPSAPSDISVSSGVRQDEEIVYQSVDGRKSLGHLFLWFSNFNSVPFYQRPSVWTGLIFALSVLAMVASAIIGNHYMIVKPLQQLSHAIQRTMKHGTRHRVGLTARTEIGELARTFDDMQERLAKEEADLTQAHQQAVNLYNRTPAMLFSLDRQGRLSAVSDYWLSATGYDRESVIGRSFADFLANAGSETEVASRLATEQAQDGDAVLVFNCADGRVIDVLVRGTGTVQIGTGAAASLSVMTDITALKQAERNVQAQAVTDRLTGIGNRHSFEAELHARIAEADQTAGEVGCLYLDLDRFKPINDTLGHSVGDQVLAIVAARLKRCVESNDAVARLGGDEFAVLISGENVSDRIAAISAQVGASLSEKMIVGPHSLQVGCSIGSALYPLHSRSAADLMRLSDAAMYAGKHATRTTTSGATRKASVNQRMLEDILTRKRTEAFLQPIVNLGNGRLVGVEALLRVRDPQRGVLPPTDFIKAAEKLGKVQSIDEEVMRQAITGIARLNAGRRRGDQLYLTMNVSALSINTPFIEKLLRTAERHQVPIRKLVLEVTETIPLEDQPGAVEALRMFRSNGGKVALDDFGTGYSFLANLCEAEVDILKIDRSFVAALTEGEARDRDRCRRALIAVSGLARTMGCDVIAEGVETEEQRYLVMAAGINRGQGYLFGRAIAVENFVSETSNGKCH